MTLKHSIADIMRLMTGDLDDLVTKTLNLGQKVIDEQVDALTTQLKDELDIICDDRACMISFLTGVPADTVLKLLNEVEVCAESLTVLANRPDNREGVMP